ncbi:embryonic polyadenylate-binding protein 2 isoform X2 [Hemicordylus capensis]|uniref:embryonic polyadenylate-binding protein 2 isoform X2 n=1 Tax=Hemicordylus capensis TaxID=884348 RepID=UPI002303039A|nr:embryonic polyadenylate-binding protein 2 isoform X2 [Hemicordylus capensis]
MFGLGASPFFPDTGSWWHEPPSLAAADTPWDVAEIAAWQKHLEEETDLSPLEGDSLELLQAEDPELEAIKAKIREMEKEDEQLKMEAKNLIMRSEAGLSLPRTAEEKVEADQRSIYVGNVDYGGTAEELESHFNGCGQINRVTILCDKFSGHPKGCCPKGPTCQGSAPPTVAVFPGAVSMAGGACLAAAASLEGSVRGRVEECTGAVEGHLLGMPPTRWRNKKIQEKLQD